MCWHWLARPTTEGMGELIPPSGPPAPHPHCFQSLYLTLPGAAAWNQGNESAGGKEYPLDNEARQRFPALGIHLLSNYYVPGVVSGAARDNEEDTERRAYREVNEA